MAKRKPKADSFEERWLLICMGERKPSSLLDAIEKLDPPAPAKKSFWNEAANNLESDQQAV